MTHLYKKTALCRFLYNKGNSLMLSAPHRSEVKSSPSIRQARQIARLALVAIVGISYFFVAVVILHFLRPDYDPVKRAVSNYAIGPYGFLMVSAFFALALSLFALALGLARRITLSSRSQVGLRLLKVASVGMIVTGIFPGDLNGLYSFMPTVILHWLAAGVSFSSITVAALLFSMHFKMEKEWRSFQCPSFALALTVVVGLFAFSVLTFVGWFGIGQRIYITVTLLWLFLVAVRLRFVASR
jgi:hypothetical protein